MQELQSILSGENLVFVLGGIAAVILVLILWTWSVSARVRAISARKSTKLEEGSVGDMVSTFEKHAVQIEQMQAELESLSSVSARMGQELSNCFQRAGIVRFNAFDDSGGEQSFALALIDTHMNGVIITNLHSRDHSRFYAKLVRSGAAETSLSGEEKKALEKALGQPVPVR